VTAKPPADRTILIIDDDASMRLVFEMYLQSFGYTVLVASNGKEALEVAGNRSDINAVLVDVVMSGLSGRCLADELRALVPDSRILFCSGYPAETVASYGIDLTVANFLQKPCRPADLKQKLQELLTDT
jgi:CheY-like chemotaxis protein